MSPHRLTNFEIQKCYKKGHKFNGVYSRNFTVQIMKNSLMENIIFCAVFT